MKSLSCENELLGEETDFPSKEDKSSLNKGLGPTPCEESGVFCVVLEEPENVPFQGEFSLIGITVPNEVLDKERCPGL